jgi:parallel beta-helix repeat protein
MSQAPSYLLCTLLCAAALIVSAVPAAAEANRILLVDDDGAQCPGALRTIQEALAQAPAHATILVCPGTYRNTVKVSGHAKDGIRLIAIGYEGEVVLAGDHTEAHGIHLSEVDSVLIRGFTIRDFGNKRTTSAQYGWGSGIYLQNAAYNTLEFNGVTNTDLGGIILSGSPNNVVRHNFVAETDPTGFGCGIYLEGRKSSHNLIFQNYIYRESGAGIHLGDAGPGNVVLDNNASNNGHSGLLHEGTEGTWIEGNRFSYNAGAWGDSPYGKGRSTGIYLRKSSKVTLFDNAARNNTAVDISWDNAGEIVFDSNACGTADRPGLCGK